MENGKWKIRKYTRIRLRSIPNAWHEVTRLSCLPLSITSSQAIHVNKK